MTNSILVIGATGNLGREVVRQLVSKGNKVRVAVRHPGNYPVSSPLVEVIRFDFDDPTSFCPALDSIDRVFLISRPLDPEAPSVLAPVIQASKQAGVKQIVFTSALGVDQNEEAPLRQVERLLETSGIDYTFLRPNFFMDNFSTGFIAPMLESANGIFVAAEAAKTSFIAISDIASVAVAALTEEEHASKAYNLTGPEGLNHSIIAAVISSVSGREINYHSISEEEMCKGALDNGLPEPNVGYLSVLYQVTRTGYLSGTTPDVEEVLGRPPINFVEFAQLNKTAWQKSQAANH
jgi:uncharacterized protein YbjT (DUF2867 family)